MKTTGDKAGVEATRESKGPAAGSRLGVGSCRGRTRIEEGGFQGWQRGEDAEMARQKEEGFPGEGGDRGGPGEGEDCELASDVALPFLGFTSFIRCAAGSSRAVELRFLLFWKHTKSENSRYCGCKGLKCFLFRASGQWG